MPDLTNTFVLHLARIRALDAEIVRVDAATTDFRNLAGRIRAIVSDDRISDESDATRYGLSVVEAVLTGYLANLSEARSAAVAVAVDSFNAADSSANLRS